jgi:hypothetical protein
LIACYFVVILVLLEAVHLERLFSLPSFDHSFVWLAVFKFRTHSHSKTSALGGCTAFVDTSWFPIPLPKEKYFLFALFLSGLHSCVGSAFCLLADVLTYHWMLHVWTSELFLKCVFSSFTAPTVLHSQ